jgi:DNA invertase Pin-like site-specific DNA recombinase
MKASAAPIFAYRYTDPLLGGSSSVPLQFPVDRLYQDLGSRQQFEQLIADCKASDEPIAYVWLPYLEDLGDSLLEVNDRLAQFTAVGVEVRVGSDRLPLSDLSLQSELLTLWQMVQAQQNRRLQRGHARNRLKALPPPGRAPYGYRRGKEHYLLDRSTAPVIKDFFEHFLLYGSLRQSIRYLQKKYGKKISVSTGKRWLSNPVYRGDLSYRQGEIISNTHAAILSRQEAAQIDRLLRRNRSLPPRAASAPRSLSGLVVCGPCQSTLKVNHVARRGYEYLYLCPTACPRKPKCRAIAYQQVLEQAIQRICTDLLPAIQQAALPDVDGIKQNLGTQISTKQAALTQLPSLVETGILDDETANLRTYQLKTEIAALQSRLAQLPPVNLKATAEAVSIPQFWLDLSESERRFYFREFIQQIRLVRSDPAEAEADSLNTWSLELSFMF